MNSQQLLYVNIILGLFFAAYFLLGRGKTRTPTKLNLKANEDFKKFRAADMSAHINKNRQLNTAPSKDEASPDSGSVTGITSPNEPQMTILEPENVIDISAGKAIRHSKNISIYFMYNGHEWEAHEVLGVPAGAALPVVTDMYQKLILNSDPSTFEFYESAHQAILKRWKDRRG